MPPQDVTRYHWWQTLSYNRSWLSVVTPCSRQYMERGQICTHLSPCYVGMNNIAPHHPTVQKDYVCGWQSKTVSFPFIMVCSCAGNLILYPTRVRCVPRDDSHSQHPLNSIDGSKRLVTSFSVVMRAIEVTRLPPGHE